MRKRLQFTGHSGDGGNSGVVKLTIENKKMLLHQLLMKVRSGALTAANISRVLLTATYDTLLNPADPKGGSKINTEAIWDISGTRLDEFNKRKGMVAMTTNNILTMCFEMFNMKSEMMTYATSLNFLVRSKATGKMLTKLEVEITYASGTTPLVDFYGDMEGATPDGPGAIPRLKVSQTPSIASSSVPDQDYTALPTGKENRFYSWLGLIPASDNVLIAKLVNDSGDIAYADRALENQLQVNSERVLGTYFSLAFDFNIDGISDPFDTEYWGKPVLKVAQETTGIITYVIATFGE